MTTSTDNAVSEAGRRLVMPSLITGALYAALGSYALGLDALAVVRGSVGADV
jgi:hypothetical protein